MATSSTFFATAHKALNDLADAEAVPLPPAPLDRSYTDRDLGERVRREIDRIERLKKRIAR